MNNYRGKIIESRPCVCNRVTTGLYYIASDCLDCWSYYFDPVWSERWGKPKDKKPPNALLEDLNPDLKNQIKLQVENQYKNFSKDYNEKEKNYLKSLPCINLGTIVSRANCNCPFKFVHKCDKHGFCVRGEQQTPDVRSCLDCPDYEPDDPNA